MPRRPVQSQRLRQQIAYEAARLIAEHGIGDYLLAKRKAAAALGVVDKGSLPRNSEIESALRALQMLFAGDEHDERLADMRRHTLQAMQQLARFEPRAVGPVVSGAIGINSQIELHVFAEPAELVALELLERHIDHETTQARVRYEREQQPTIMPAVAFLAGNYDVTATVFPLDGQRQAPLSPVDGRPARRLSMAALEALLPVADHESRRA